ncbi:MAG TPA: hypothetical protein VGM88_27555 [Kofleriaceae bacterium]
MGALHGRSAAQSQAELASKLNDDGKALMYQKDFAGASAKFREAVARVPEAKYFFNLCMSLYQDGHFDEALTACNAVPNNNASADQKDKADKLVGKIRETAQKQNITLHEGGVGGGGGETNLPPDPNTPPTTDPNTPPNANNGNGTPVSHPPDGSPLPDGNGQPAGYRPAVGRPPEESLYVATRPDNHYTWTLGADFFFGGGQIGQKDAYGNVAVGARVHADYMLVPKLRLGASAWGQFTQYSSGKAVENVSHQLEMLDLGVGLYKHFCVRDRVCLTPLLGVQLAFEGPGDMMDSSQDQLFNYLAVGARGELNLSFGLGRRYEHVFSIMAGFNAYTKALQSPATDPAETEGLDKGGVMAYFGLGYTYRFNTPIGATAFVTLE